MILNDSQNLRLKREFKPFSAILSQPRRLASQKLVRQPPTNGAAGWQVYSRNDRQNFVFMSSLDPGVDRKFRRRRRFGSHVASIDLYRRTSTYST